jgi:hypothetical protein
MEIVQAFVEICCTIAADFDVGFIGGLHEKVPVVVQQIQPETDVIQLFGRFICTPDSFIFRVFGNVGFDEVKVSDVLRRGVFLVAGNTIITQRGFEKVGDFSKTFDIRGSVYHLMTFGAT